MKRFDIDIISRSRPDGQASRKVVICGFSL